MDYSHLLKKLPLNFDVIIPFIGRTAELISELGRFNSEVVFQNEKIVLTSPLASKPIWAQDWWPNCESYSLNQKTEAVRILKTKPNLGVYYSSGLSKRAESIRQELRELKLKRINFEVNSKFNFKFFSWTILNDQYLIIAPEQTQQFPLGWHEFNEDKSTPPNRAYLKLWELLALGHISNLNPEDSVVELGASPGGWTWVLADIFKKVYAVDRSDLDPKVKKKLNIVMKIGDAFQIDPSHFKDSQWLFSDLICTPEKLYELVLHWKKNSSIKNFVCTIKFKGFIDFNIMDQFLKIEGSKIIHLYQNKNELTWVYQDKK